MRLDRAPDAGRAVPSGHRAALEVFRAFLALGLSAFGGPIAHLGYFRHEFVQRRRWLDEARYAELVALGQFLPGPASSQVGFAIGLERAGWRGGLAAWLGFTLPSAVALVLFARGLAYFDPAAPVPAAALHALKIVAVAVVAQALVSMARALCPDLERRALALLAAAVVLVRPEADAQLVALVACALAGVAVLRDGVGVVSTTLGAAASDGRPAPSFSPRAVSPRAGASAALLFTVLLIALPWAAAMTGKAWIALWAAFYRAGALVFGGGHVVLPLLQAGVVEPGWIDAPAFVAGYGAAQAVPGPLFTFAAYLGSVIGAGGPALLDPAAWGWAALCVLAIFLPGMLVLIAALPWWSSMGARPPLRRAIAGVNAGVVGVLAAAWLDPVATSAVHGPVDALFAAALFALLVGLRWPPWAVVAAALLAGVLRALVA